MGSPVRHRLMAAAAVEVGVEAVVVAAVRSVKPLPAATGKALE